MLTIRGRLITRFILGSVFVGLSIWNRHSFTNFMSFGLWLGYNDHNYFWLFHCWLKIHGRVLCCRHILSWLFHVSETSIRATETWLHALFWGPCLLVWAFGIVIRLRILWVLDYGLGTMTTTTFDFSIVDWKYMAVFSAAAASCPDCFMFQRLQSEQQRPLVFCTLRFPWHTEKQRKLLTINVKKRLPLETKNTLRNRKWDLQVLVKHKSFWWNARWTVVAKNGNPVVKCFPHLLP